MNALMNDRGTMELRFTGDYSLVESARLAAHAGFVGPLDDEQDGPGGPVLDLAFPLDGSWNTVGVRVEQNRSGVRATVFANPGRAAHDDVRDQLRRILWLDHDRTRFAAVGRRDQVIGDLQARFTGVRPVLHPSPYEAAARAIIMHRLYRGQAAAVTARVAEQRGEVVEVAGRAVHAFPTPKRLADLEPVQGLAGTKVAQLRALGRAADGDSYTAATLRGMDHDAAMAHLQKLPGVGPFSAELILIRGVGDPDVFPRTEKSLHRAMAQAYDLGDDPDLDTLQTAAEPWRPHRSWVGLLFRHLVE